MKNSGYAPTLQPRSPRRMVECNETQPSRPAPLVRVLSAAVLVLVLEAMFFEYETRTRTSTILRSFAGG